MEQKKTAILKIFGKRFFGVAAPAVFTLLFFAFAHAASAASLYLSPAAGTEAVGQSFTVGIYVSSADQAMNAAEGVISFPSDKVDVIAVSIKGSMMTLWVQPPSFSNKDAVVNFQGVVVNPGFQGVHGAIVTITFRAKAKGDVALVFTSGTVLANDGKGTNILDGFTGANFTIVAAPPVSSSSPSGSPSSSASSSNGQTGSTTESSTASTAPQGNGSNWFTDALGFILGLGIVVFLGIALALLIAALLYAIYHRLNVWRLKLKRQTLMMRKDLYDDLKSIDEELKRADSSRNIEKEIEHIKKDLEKDIDSIDNVEQ